MEFEFRPSLLEQIANVEEFQLNSHDDADALESFDMQLRAQVMAQLVRRKMAEA